MAHTRWHVGYTHTDAVVVVVDEAEREIADVNFAGNARLIAAAPELLEMLRKMTDYAESERISLRDCTEFEADVTAARAAIAKAEGK